jgi:hypothetical protein
MKAIDKGIYPLCLGNEDSKHSVGASRNYKLEERNYVYCEQWLEKYIEKC